MMQHQLHTRMTLPVTRSRVFEFFAQAANLEQITPPEMRFSILTPQPIAMQTGALIDYRLSLFGVPFKWKTRISAWSPPDFFIDEQLSGPYALWVHRHTFRALSETETEIEDDVTYSLPLSPLGEIAYPVVRWQLMRIFQFRQKAVQALLSKAWGLGR